MISSSFSAVAPDHIDVDVPLQPTTDNSEHVALLVKRILADAETFANRRGASTADVVQALSIAAALRAAMADVNTSSDGKISLDLLDVGVFDRNPI
ncbi:MAG: hypothetical protein K9M02_07790 [Thiohalocapsa sp.]|jgi:hypothetical protein|nr:hypothetical protein [Thiohalocapsa sp.]